MFHQFYFWDASRIFASSISIILKLNSFYLGNIPLATLYHKILKIVEFPESLINFVHRNDVINATEFAIENDLNGIFNLCSNEHPTKKEIYSFNSKKYNFDIPIFLDNNFFLDRKINGSKIEKLGFKYKYNDVFSF